MLRVKAGELHRLGLLYERYKLKLFGFFYRMHSNTAVSEDLVQIVFVKILRARQSFTGEGEFSMWMYTIARNASYDNFKKSKKRHEDIFDYANSLESNENIEQDFSKNEEVKLLNRALQCLDHDHKEVLQMSRFENLKYSQIAEIIGVSEGAVKMKVKRALVNLKRQYEKLEQGKHYEK